MKFIHIGDLHIGKRVNEFSMLEEQIHVLQQIVEAADHEQVDGVLIAGDIYDKNTPSAEAVRVFDRFITELAEHGISIYAVSGNHDSADRLAFAASILEKRDVHFSRPFDGKIEHFTLCDENGPLELYLLPFLKPAMVRPFFLEENIDSYDDAIRCVLDRAEIAPTARNILLAHQFVVSGENTPEQCESETVSVGGVDSVSAELFNAFDYVALGHIHGAQWIGRETIRYSGSPLKYSFSEIRHHKSLTLVTIKEKGNVVIQTIPLTPIHEMREIRGPIEELLSPMIVSQGDYEDYLHVTLTDDAVMDAAARVRSVYPNLMRLDFDNVMTRTTGTIKMADIAKQRSGLERFADFYEQQNGEPLTGEKLEWMKKLFREVEEES